MATWPNTWCKSVNLVVSFACFLAESPSLVLVKLPQLCSANLSDQHKKMLRIEFGQSLPKWWREKTCEFFTQIDIPKIWVKVTSSWGGIFFSQNTCRSTPFEEYCTFSSWKSIQRSHPIWQFSFWCRWRSTAGSEHRRRAYSHRTGVNS